MGRYALAVAVLAAVPAAAEVIYETADPFGGPFGLWGPDVCIDQSVGLRFTPGADYHTVNYQLSFGMYFVRSARNARFPSRCCSILTGR